MTEGFEAKLFCMVCDKETKHRVDERITCLVCEKSNIKGGKRYAKKKN